MIGFQFQRVTDLTCCRRLAVASNRVQTQIILHTERFFLTFRFTFQVKIMADVANKYAENVPGKFYVDDQCIDCDLCRETAPANFKRNDDGGHSYVYKQPETPEEEGLCKEAMEGCPVEAIGNDGA
jgi:ferredoxin